MARTHARVQAALWIDEDWRALSSAAQRVYLLLISQPQINNVGVLPLVLKRWARLAADTSPRSLTDALGELEEARFIVCDWESEEVLVRTFVKHDRVDAQPKLVVAAKRQLLEVESPRIKYVLVTLYDWLLDDLPESVKEALLEPLSEGVSKGVSEPLSEGVNARAREGLQDAGVGVGMQGSALHERSSSERAMRELQDAHRSLEHGHAQEQDPDSEAELDDDPEPLPVDLPDPVTAGDVGPEARRMLGALRPRGATA